MKHISALTHHLPAKALTNDHPSLWDSIEAFIADPIGVLELHLKKDTNVDVA